MRIENLLKEMTGTDINHEVAGSSGENANVDLQSLMHLIGQGRDLSCSLLADDEKQLVAMIKARFAEDSRYQPSMLLTTAIRGLNAKLSIC